MRMRDMQQAWEIKEAGWSRQLEESSFKTRQKGEEANLTLKRLREENTELLC
jgi:hypothetical protein